MMFPTSVVSLCLCLWSVLAVARTPSRMLWKPSVAATEWGHWLGWMAALTAGGQWFLGVSGWSIVPTLAAAALFHVPLIRSFTVAPQIRRRVETLRRQGDHWDRSFRQRAPVVLSSLLHVPLPRMSPQRHVYREIDGQALTLDFYKPVGGPRQATTLVVVVHGGSWSSGDSSQLTGMNRYLAACGYPVAALNYRLAPRFRFPAPVDDIGAAVRYLESGRAGFSGRWDHVVVLGRSSGGHLALLAAYSGIHPRIHGVIALYAPTDLVWSWQRPAPARLMDSNGAIRGHMGGSPAEMPRRFEQASPIRLVGPELPPTMLLHGGNDELVSPHQSRRLAAALDGAGAVCVHLELPWGKHGMDANLAGPGGQIVLYAVERFLHSVDAGQAKGSEVETARE